MTTPTHNFVAAGSALSLLLLAGCGGGGGGADAGAVPAAATSTTTLSGVAAKGPLKGALVTAFPVGADGVVGSTELGHATTDNGAYSVNVGSYVGAVQLVVTAPAGATSADEATGQDIALPASFRLHADTVVVAASGAASQSASITPYTELAHRIATASGGPSAANIAAANTAVFALIGLDPVATLPVASNAATAGTGTDAQKRYGLLNAAVSQLAASTSLATDDVTRTCLVAAGDDKGRRIDCVVQQVAGAVTVSGSGAQAVVKTNDRLDGLAAALVAVSADDRINRTGTHVSGDDALVVALVAGTPVTPATAPAGSDVDTAKAFFKSLRSNAAALQTGAVDTGIVDGIKAFGDSLSNEASEVSSNTVRTVELSQIALLQWNDFRAGRRTNPTNASVRDFDSGNVSLCTVYQGTFPNQLGAGAGVDYEPPLLVVATTPANASYVACSVASGPVPPFTSWSRTRQRLWFNMSADPALAVVPYLASTQFQYQPADPDRPTRAIELTGSLSGTIRYQADAAGNPTAFSIVGDLPPKASWYEASSISSVPMRSNAELNLKAERYPVDIAGTMTTTADGTSTIAFSHGSLGTVPLGAAAPALVVDLSSDGQSFAVLPPKDRLADKKFFLAATITDSHGKLSGSLLLDRFASDDGAASAHHAHFEGSAAVAPVVDGRVGALVTFLGGSIDATDGDTPSVSFSGSLTLPNRPTAKLTASVTGSSADTFTLAGRYVQDGLIVNISGSEAAGKSSATFASSSGVSVSVAPGLERFDVTVAGRKAAVIDRGAKTITYVDGSFESLF